jgi:DsbC/DsbD-like thiol-disulfide interchange protein
MFKLLLLSLLAATPALAQIQSQDDVLDGALLPGWRMPGGHRMAALHLTLAPHWKTYWRAPGAAGIPPQFDWSGSSNVAEVRLHWPSPEVITLNGLQSIGYLDELVLPLEVVPIDLDQPVDLRLQMGLGICKDICMPAALTLSASLAGAGAADPAIDRALQAQPLTAAEAGVSAVSCTMGPIADGLRVQAHLVMPRQGNPETVVFEVKDPGIWVDEADESRAGSVLTGVADMVPHLAAPFVLNRSEVTITVIGQGRSVEIKGCPAP